MDRLRGLTRLTVHDGQWVEEWFAGSRLFGHNLAAFAFWLAEDRDAARPHLEAIGRSVTELPWACNGEPGELLGVVRKWAGLPVVAPTTSEAGSAPSAV